MKALSSSPNALGDPRLLLVDTNTKDLHIKQRISYKVVSAYQESFLLTCQGEDFEYNQA